MQETDRVFFIVGNSRSGTTMMLRMLNNHPDVFVLNELHFFEQLWTPADKERPLSRKEAIDLAAKLLYIQKEGYTGEMDVARYQAEAMQLLDGMNQQTFIAHHIYSRLMREVTRQNGKKIPCEKTPQNVFYIQEILELFPNARIINMVRDPRAILLSQKRKWLRRKMGATFITAKEAFRLRVNYHPYTLSKLWNAAIAAGRKFSRHPAVLTVRFEDILDRPSETMQMLCQHLQITYHPEMLEIPLASSSNEADSDEKGIKKERAGNWQKGGLSNEEIAICERTCRENLSFYGYSFRNPEVHPLKIAGWYLLFPIKLMLAFLLNLNRMKSITDTIKRRLAR